MSVAAILPRVAALVVRACDPERIVLFGSHAKGQATVESDVDLLVVGDFGHRRDAVARELRDLFRDLPVGFDVILATPGETSASTIDPTSFLGSILQSGVTLYSRQSDRVFDAGSGRAMLPGFGET